ncbi:MAG: DUF58 domain-containing protein [Euryarchaeota archaeon]|nr:DUF58 domain-containing protein [Euryarchaeota archaeon]
MRRRAGAGLLGAMALLAVVAFALRRWEIALACLPAVFFFAAAFLVSPAGGRPPDVRRVVEPDAIHAGETADVTLELSNPEGRQSGILETLDLLPPSLEVTRGVPHHVLSLGPYESRTVRYTARPHALGELELGPLRVRSRDMFHLSFEERRAGEKATLSVRRERQDARKLKLLPSAIHRPFGQVRSRLKGTGSEFFGLRDYVSTDPLRSIDWKATARLDRLISKEYEDERTGDVVLLVDLRPVTRVGAGTRNTHDASISGSIAVAEQVLSTRNRLTLLLVRDTVGVLPGITSRRHLATLLQREELPETPASHPLIHLSWVVRRSLPTGAQVVAFTPLIDDFMPRLLEELASGGFRVLVVCPAPYSGEGELSASSPSRVARELLEMRRTNRMTRLRRTMMTFEWDFTRPLAVPLNKFFRKGGGGAWRSPGSGRRAAR